MIIIIIKKKKRKKNRYCVTVNQSNIMTIVHRVKMCAFFSSCHLDITAYFFIKSVMRLKETEREKKIENGV